MGVFVAPLSDIKACLIGVILSMLSEQPIPLAKGVST